MRKTYAFYIGVLAVWAALTYAREEGYEHFEFMDAGLPFKKHGYREFILRFGGKQSSTRRWFRFRWKWLNNLYAACIFSCKTIKTYFCLTCYEASFQKK